MPCRKECYADMEKYKRTRRLQRIRNYAKTAIYPPSPWTMEHDKMVLEHKLSDAELSHIVKHSVQAIQNRRYILKNKAKNKKIMF